jgi:hypothetical protein
VHAFVGGVRVSEVAGRDSGASMDIYPGTIQSHGVDTLIWREKSDRPCRVVVQGHALDDRSDRAGRYWDFCGGTTRDGSEREVQVSAHDEPKRLVTGISVCPVNGRIKGVAIEAAIIEGEPNAATLRALGPVSAASQLNCEIVQFQWDDGFVLGADWTLYVRCERNMAAVGVRIFYERGGTPNAWQGVALLCKTIGTVR